MENEQNMKKDYNNDQQFLPTGPDDDNDGMDFESEEEFSDLVTYLEDICESYEPDQKKRFLKEFGYNFLERKDRVTGDTFEVAYDPKEDRRKRNLTEPNIDKLFVKKFGDCILNILLKYGK